MPMTKRTKTNTKGRTSRSKRNYRPAAGQYLERHKVEVLAELFEDTPYEVVANRHQVSVPYLREAVSLWQNIPDFGDGNSLPSPKLVEGEKYMFRGTSYINLPQSMRDGDNKYNKPMRYLEKVKSKCVGTWLYIFKNRAGAKESFHIFQLIEQIKKDGVEWVKIPNPRYSN